MSTEVANEREAGLMVTVGAQGVGKTYQNMYIIKEYIKDKFFNKVKGSKCLIMDTNGEYTKEQFAKNDIELAPKTIAVKDIPAWSRTPGGECRRIDAKNISIDSKIAIVEFIVMHFRNGLFVLEDINTYILSMTHMKDIISGLVNLRHRAVDVLISYQSARAVEPRIWANSRWIRMHYQSGDIFDIKGKLPELPIYKIAQILINKRYFHGDKRFFVYIYCLDNKIKGNFTDIEFREACNGFLSINQKSIRNHANQLNEQDLGKVKQMLTDQYFDIYYGN